MRRVLTQPRRSPTPSLQKNISLSILLLGSFVRSVTQTTRYYGAVSDFGVRAFILLTPSHDNIEIISFYQRLSVITHAV